MKRLDKIDLYFRQSEYLIVKMNLQKVYIVLKKQNYYQRGIVGVYRNFDDASKACTSHARQCLSSKHWEDIRGAVVKDCTSYSWGGETCEIESHEIE